MQSEAFARIPKIVKPDELLDDLDAYVVLDVRRLVEYKAGHIPRAYPCSFSHFVKLVGVALYPEDADKIASTLSSFGIEIDTPIVIYDNFYSRHSCRVAYTLELLGFKNIGLLSMSFDEYLRRRYPVSTERASNRPNSNLTLQYNEEHFVTTEKIHQIIAQKPSDTVLVDTRDIEDYNFSHISGAVNIPWHLLYRPDGLFDLESIKKIAFSKGIDRSRRLFFYCEEGTSSAFTMYGFRAAGFLRSHTYLPSYPDWLNKGRARGEMFRLRS